MPPLRNPFDAVNHKVLGEIAQYQKRALKAKPIPLGMEKVRASTAKERMASMSPRGRTEMLQELGPVETAKRLRDGGQNADL